VDVYGMLGVGPSLQLGSWFRVSKGFIGL
jgi:hypothetical protein